MLAAIEALGEVATEEVGYDVRTWSLSIERGFCAGDLTDVDGLTVSAAGVEVVGYTHSYGDNRGTPRLLTPAELLDPGCAIRATFAECLPRVDAYLRARG